MEPAALEGCELLGIPAHLIVARDDRAAPFGSACRERCMFVGDGARCERRPEWLIGSLAQLAYAYLCGVHLDFVRQIGQPATPVE